MERAQILVIGNDCAFCQLLQARMVQTDAGVQAVAWSSEILPLFMQQEYSLTIIDLPSFESSYLEIIYMIREGLPVPILALLPSLDHKETLHLFYSGVNVCLEKPIDIDLCAAQACALIQLHRNAHTNHCQDSVVLGNELIINSRYRRVLVDGSLLDLTKKEFDLFYFLASQPGRVFSHEQLCCHIWDEYAAFGNDETVKSHIKTLRKKLSTYGKHYIQNIWGIGYKFSLDTASN